MDYKAKAKEMAKSRLEKMGGKRSERVTDIMRADGGRVCKAVGGSMHDEPDGDEFDSGAEMDGESSKPRLDKPSRGGGKTTVNIIVGKGQEAPPAPPMAMPMPPPPPAGPPSGAGPMPPMPMRANGGRVQRADGGKIPEDSKAKAAALRENANKRMSADKTLSDTAKGVGTMAAGAIINGLSRGRLGKTIGNLGIVGGPGAAAATMGSDLVKAGKERSEAKSIERGEAEPGREDRASGGRMTAGAESGEGRLQKAALARKHK